MDHTPNDESAKEHRAARANLIQNLPAGVFRATATEQWQEAVDRLGDPCAPPLDDVFSLLLSGNPIKRDGHLLALDHLLVPLIEGQRLNAVDLDAVASAEEDMLLLVNTPLEVPAVWRWLLSAERRRLITPMEGELSVHTRWDLTEEGRQRAQEEWPLRVALWRLGRRHLGKSISLLLSVVGVIGASVVGDFAREILTAVAVMAGLLLMLIVFDEIRSRWPDRFNPSLRSLSPAQFTVWREVGLQHAVQAHPELARPWGFDPPPKQHAGRRTKSPAP